MLRTGGKDIHKGCVLYILQSIAHVVLPILYMKNTSWQDALSLTFPHNKSTLISNMDIEKYQQRGQEICLVLRGITRIKTNNISIMTHLM